MSRRWTLIFGLWFFAGLIAVGLLMLGVSYQQAEIDHLYSLINLTNLSPAGEDTETAKLYRLVAERSFLAHVLWVSFPIGLVMPAIGAAWLFVRSRISN